MKTVTVVTLLACLLSAPDRLRAQPSAATQDSVVLGLVKDEGYNHSQVMSILSEITDVRGPRLTWSPEFLNAAEWAAAQLASWGVQNVHFDAWTPMGKGWSFRNFTARLVKPVVAMITGYPKAWSAGFKTTTADVVYLDVRSPQDFERYRGRLKGTVVLINDVQTINAHFEPEARRQADSILLRMANSDVATGRERVRLRPGLPAVLPDDPDSAFAVVRKSMPNADSMRIVRMIGERRVGSRKLRFAQDEGALAVLTAGRGDGGTFFVQEATYPQPPDRIGRQNVYDPNTAAFVPQIAVAAEHYNRMVRMIEKGEKLKMEIGLDVLQTKPDSGRNIIGEIPGSDRADELVMIGAHFDSWQAGTGATDNGTGSSVCMEAMRILQSVMKKSGMAPRRTIRIGLWGGEEQGLIGSREYVSEILGKTADGSNPPVKTAAYDKFCVYFNNDNGSGKVRGVYLQGNESARPIFRAWLKEMNDPSAQTLTLQNTGGTDHLSFDRIGLPGFQFIQDPIEYDTRTHHSNMDVYDRAQEEDLKQAAVFMAYFAYKAAMMEGQFPRKTSTGSESPASMGTR